MVKRSLKNLLRYFIDVNLRNWDLILPIAEFACNSSVNMSIGMSLFEVVHVYKFRKPIDLISMTHHPRISEFASVFASHVHDLHKEINNKVQKNNAHYKFNVDLQRMHLEFNEGDFVMIRIRPERFSLETIKKLHARNTCPYKILKKIIQMLM